MLSREHSARNRVIGNHADALFRAERQQFTFDFAIEHIVARLHGDEASPPVHVAAAQRARHLVRQVIRAADVSNLAGAHQIVERAESLV